jgi:hypothetical protein
MSSKILKDNNFIENAGFLLTFAFFAWPASIPPEGRPVPVPYMIDSDPASHIRSVNIAG